MAIEGAIRFIRDAERDPALRESCYRAEGSMLDHIASLGYIFTMHEFDDAIRSMKLKCQHAYQAEALVELETWFRFLIGAHA